MNKKLITAALAASMLISSTAVFASYTEKGTETQGDVMLTETGTQVSAAKKFEKVQVEVSEIKDNVLKYTADKEEKEADVTDAVVLDNKGAVKKVSDIKAKDTVMLFTDINDGKVKYIAIAAAEDGINVDIDVFSKSETLGDYVDTQNMLAIYANEDMDITDLEGNKLKIADIENKYIAVFYNMATMSIPAITNPLKVVVLEDAPEATAAPEATVAPEATDAPEATPIEVIYDYEMNIDNADVLITDNVKLVPVRKYAEGLDLEVVWNGEDKSVTVGTIPMGVQFKIGENSYSKSKMTPFVLEVAPQLINDKTYVPVSFFEEVLNAKVTIAE